MSKDDNASGSEPADAGSLERDGSVPKRRFGIELTAGADTREELASLLDHIACEITQNPGVCGSTIGGCNYGGHYEIEDRGDHVTAESYRADLAIWVESKRRQRRQNNEMSDPA